MQTGRLKPGSYFLQIRMRYFATNNQEELSTVHQLVRIIHSKHASLTSKFVSHSPRRKYEPGLRDLMDRRYPNIHTHHDNLELVETASRELLNTRWQHTYQVNVHCLRSSEHAHSTEKKKCILPGKSAAT